MTRHVERKTKAPEAILLQRLYASIIMRAKVACTRAHQLSRAQRHSSSDSLSRMRPASRRMRLRGGALVVASYRQRRSGGPPCGRRYHLGVRLTVLIKRALIARGGRHTLPAPRVRPYHGVI